MQKLTKERRPNGAANGFPSGHAASAFSGATFIHKRYGLRQAAVPYVAALLVGYSRVYSGWHYAHDIAGSAVVSGLWSWLVVGRKTPVMLSADSDGARLDFSFKF